MSLFRSTKKTYTFEITIKEGNDEFWEGLKEEGKTGTDELLEHIKDVFSQTGYDLEVKLVKYEDS